jgi:hypothetical protein
MSEHIHLSLITQPIPGLNRIFLKIDDQLSIAKIDLAHLGVCCNFLRRALGDHLA